MIELLQMLPFGGFGVNVGKGVPSFPSPSPSPAPSPPKPFFLTAAQLVMTHTYQLHTSLNGNRQTISTADGKHSTLSKKTSTRTATATARKSELTAPESTSTRMPYKYGTPEYREAKARHTALKAKQAKEAEQRAEALKAKTALTDEQREWVDNRVAEANAPKPRGITYLQDGGRVIH